MHADIHYMSDDQPLVSPYQVPKPSSFGYNTHCPAPVCPMALMVSAREDQPSNLVSQASTP